MEFVNGILIVMRTTCGINGLLNTNVTHCWRGYFVECHLNVHTCVLIFTSVNSSLISVPFATNIKYFIGRCL